MRVSSVSISIIVGLVTYYGKTEGAEISRAPKLVDSVDILNHPEDTNATFTCSIGSGDLEGLEFEWFKDEKRIIPASNKAKYWLSVQPDNYISMLRVLDLKFNDSGQYSCLAKNSFGKDKISTRLNVKVPLKWIIEPKDVLVSVGKPLLVPCSASGLPEARIQWRKLPSGKVLGSKLSFASIAQQEAGFYECRAINDLEKDLVASVNVNVRGK